MKDRLIFVTGPCCSLPSLCNGSSVAVTAGSTAGTGFLVSGVGGSMVGPECQGHRRNDAVAGMTFVKTRRCHKVLMCKKGGGARSLLLAVKNHRCFCSSTSNRGTDFAQKGRICKFSGMFQTRIQIFRDLRNGTSSDFVSDFAKLQHAFICAPCGETS